MEWRVWGYVGGIWKVWEWSIPPPNVLEENVWHPLLSASTGTHQNSVGGCLTLFVVTDWTERKFIHGGGEEDILE